jgi:hypothetical protein
MRDDVRVTARTLRTAAGTTHTVYEANGLTCHSLDALEAALASTSAPSDDAHCATP